ncbi:hypothetical protein ACFX2I_041851 [Malus domestica]
MMVCKCILREALRNSGAKTQGLIAWTKLIDHGQWGHASCPRVTNWAFHSTEAGALWHPVPQKSKLS